MVLAIPGFFLARELWRTVRSRSARSESPPLGTVNSTRPSHNHRPGRSRNRGRDAQAPPATPTKSRPGGSAPRRRGPQPAAGAARGPQQMGLGRSEPYIFSIPSNVLMIVGSSLGYFYFAGLQTFALLFVKGHYGASQAIAELVAGAARRRCGDRHARRRPRARLAAQAGRSGGASVVSRVPATSARRLLLIPGFVRTSLTPAVWFDVAGAALISAANPPLQAARLDVVPAGLWGRTQARSRPCARCPRRSRRSSSAASRSGWARYPARRRAYRIPARTRPSSTTTGLEITFLIMLTALIAASTCYSAREGPSRQTSPAQPRPSRTTKGCEPAIAPTSTRRSKDGQRAPAK